MQFILFDSPSRRLALQPFTFLRTIAEIPLGLSPLYEKWKAVLDGSASFLSEEYLSCETSFLDNDNLGINSALLPTPSLIRAIHNLQPNEQLVQGDVCLALKGTQEVLLRTQHPTFTTDPSLKSIPFEEELIQMNHLWDLFLHNEAIIAQEFQQLTSSRSSLSIEDDYTKVVNPESIFVEEGADIQSAFLNADQGPIYIGKNAIIHPGSILNGPLLIGEGVHIKSGAIVSGPTIIGKCAKVGGEVHHSTFFPYSNKAHAGYVGHSVIGSWCNMGAGTCSSNLKNDYGVVRVWDYEKKDFLPSEQQFCGLFMGDHSKCGILTKFNTGTVVGISSNVANDGFCPKFIPSFSWASGQKPVEDYQWEKAIEVAERCMARRNQGLSAQEKSILRYVFDMTATYRQKN